MIILLLGLMGSGRSSIGSCLASSLGSTLIEVEDEVLKKTGHKNTSEAYKGNIIQWKEVELEFCKELAKRDNLVVATSNTFIENDLNIHYFKDSDKEIKIVYLRTDPEVLTKRLTSLHASFKKEGSGIIMKKVKDLYSLRDSMYSKYADLTVDTDNKIPMDACKVILKKLGK